MRSSNDSPRAEAAIATRLDALATRHPAIAPLRALLGPTLALTPAFLAAYDASTAPTGQRAMLLRTVFGDPTSGLPAAGACVTGPLLQRFVAWLEWHGALGGIDRGRDLIPKGFAALLGEPRDAYADFIARIAVRPWWHLQTTGCPNHPALDALPASTLAPLGALFRARTLTAAEARFLASPASDRSTPTCRWYFATGCAPLDLRNALVFLAALLEERDGGLAQNRIPRALTDRWGIPRLSVPHALLFCDIATLAADGCLALDPRTDPLGLIDAVASPAARSLVTSGDDDAAAAARARRTRPLIDPDAALQRHAQLTHGMRDGMFDTGLVFNADRLLQMDAFHGYRPYYDAIIPRALAALVRGHWQRVTPEGRSWPSRLQASGHAPIRVRDLGNILAYLAALDIALDDRPAVWRALPSVARYALGTPEPVACRRSAGHSPRRGAITPARAGPLPGLAALSANAGRRAYVIEAGTADRPPADGWAVVHAPHAAAHTVPAGIDVIGDAPLPWGVDPVEAALALLRAEGWHAERYPPAVAP
jgi:hypothetical protein